VVALLGASNLARAQPALVRHVRRSLAPRPVEVLAAVGPGRAYCVEGGFLHVRYPTLACSEVIDVVRARAPGARIAVLVTDIGNDLLYGVPAERVIETLDRLLDDLVGLGARVVVSTIHVDVAQDVSPLRFRLLRALFFATSALGYDEAADAVRRINQFLETKRGPNVHLLTGMRAYAGWTRIHYSLLRAHRGWSVVAGELEHALGAEPCCGIGWLQMMASIAEYLARLVVRDLWPPTRVLRRDYTAC